MAKANQHKIGCFLGNKEGSAGSRTKIIDPNAFYGEQDSSRNIPVRVEDLTIYVKLTTTKKSRTTIFNDTNNNETNVKEQKGVTINFIEGSDINGKKVLTTKFTELTTVFENDTINPETFGITNIDIDFNSSHTPMVKIDFVDVRGSSIFQNEELLLNNETENKYATFFEFPYPLFELEIKGYYGQPVTYCLHMLKFNSKFNSQTGNFEISCDFIGYTYALLSDMLVGVLKAIPYTKIGGEKFEKYNEERKLKNLPRILNLVELNTAISNINNTIKKIGKTSEESKVINTFNQVNEYLEAIRISYLGLSDEFSVNKKPQTTEPENPIFVVVSGDTISTTKNEVRLELNKEIKQNIKKINDLNINGLTINENDLLFPDRITGLKPYMLEPDYQLNPFGTLKTPEDVVSFKNDLKQYINNYIGLSSDFSFSVWDLRSRFKLIEEKKDLAQKSLDDNNKELALRLKDAVSKELGFEPTIRNMIEIFTALIEVFIETVYEVSNKAEKNVKRRELLSSVFSPGNNDYVNNDNFYPWPAYSEIGKSQSYVETYLGSNSQIKQNINDVDELVFIDNLLYAFLTANREENKNELLNSSIDTIYVPCNPLDTLIYENTGNPYIRQGQILDQNQALRTLLIRAMTFLGYTNNQDYLTTGENGEIEKMAELEAQMMYEALIEPKLKPLFQNITLDRILKANGVISGTDRKVVEVDGDNYYYNYAAKGDPDTVKLLPVGYDLNGEDITIFTDESNNPSQTGMIEYSNQGKLFLTNYNPNYDNTTYIDNRKFDGGVYIKIITQNEYEPDSNLTLFDASLNTDSVLDLKALSGGSIDSAGFNSFGGPYGIQDFNNINYGSDSGVPEDTPAMFVFYSNEGTFNGLGEVRKDGVSSKWDFKPNALNLYGFNRTESHKSIYYSNGSPLTGKFLHNNLGNNRTLATTLINEPNKVSYPYINYPLNANSRAEYYLPLFGSKFYYNQKNSVITKLDNTPINNIAEYYVKGLLFLNTIPFNINYDENEDPFNKPEIRHLFDIKAGFIHVPRLWAAYVGGLLWWLSQENPEIDLTSNQIVGGGRGKNDPIIWNHACSFEVDIEDSLFKAPENNQYLPKFLLGDRNDIDEDSPLLTMPVQAKDEFKKVFFDFINGPNPTDFKQLADKLEIYKGLPTNFCKILNRLTKYETAADSSGLVLAVNSGSFIQGSSISDNLVNENNYNIITPLDETKISQIQLRYMFLELNGASGVATDLLNLFKEELILVNTGVKIWEKSGSQQTTSAPPQVTASDVAFRTEQASRAASSDSNTSLRVGITVKKSIFETYIAKFVDTMKELTDKDTFSGQEEKEFNEIFGTNNKNEIKLMLYRHCKNIYDKWLGGVDNPNNVIFQCGDNSRKESNRNQTDLKLANKLKPNGSERPRLIDSFRFVTRSFRDIGDELFINPIVIQDQVTDFPNTSAYNIISGLLNDNKFEFIALPSFINFKDDKMLESIFTPYEYSEAITSCGPSFVCVYTGQRSNRLDIKSGKYPNDGFDMRCTNGIPDPSIPSDFSEPLNEYEDPVAVFEVNYSQQNQNIFKDITLDQSEFIETEESLKIVQDISTKGFENSPSFAGQNMYNIYAVRSYSTEIEMLGNAMIQPMMYFQLNNIPMFHGAYMIIRARHNIKPNHMTTWFTGTRIKAIESPIIDVADVYMNLIETLNLGDSVSTNAVVSGSYPPIVRTLIDNGAANGNVEVGQIKLKTVGDIEGVKITASDKRMITEATDSLVEMFKAFVTFAKEESYPTDEGYYIGISSLYRSQEYQEELYRESNGDGSAARAGFSNHSWGIAVDIKFIGHKDGVYFKKNKFGPVDTKANKEGFNFEYNPSLKWFLNNSYKYGFIIPKNLRDTKGTDEYWHFEYHGTSAKCLYNKLPSTYGYTPRLDSGYKPIVKNPKGIDGKEAVYLENECDFKYVAGADGSEGDYADPSLLNNLTGDWVARAKYLITKLESYVKKAYYDVNKYRGGYGSDKIVLAPNTQPVDVTSTTTFTKQQAELTLEYDVNNRFKNGVIKQIGLQTWNRLNDNQKAALIVYTYNTGAGALKTYGIIKPLTDGKYKEAARKIAAGPITSDGKVLTGLVKRRKLESLLFEKPV